MTTSEPVINLLLHRSDRCAHCGVALAIDQRYCVACGARRGKARFAIAQAAPDENLTGATAAVAAGWTRISGILAVIAVLLAIGVGVLIGATIRGGTVSAVRGTQHRGGASSSVTATPGGGSGSCANGTPGCRNGKQTGNFFGG